MLFFIMRKISNVSSQWTEQGHRRLTTSGYIILMNCWQYSIIRSFFLAVRLHFSIDTTFKKNNLHFLQQWQFSKSNVSSLKKWVVKGHIYTNGISNLFTAMFSIIKKNHVRFEKKFAKNLRYSPTLITTSRKHPYKRETLI